MLAKTSGKLEDRKLDTIWRNTILPGRNTIPSLEDLNRNTHWRKTWNIVNIPFLHNEKGPKGKFRKRFKKTNIGFE